MIKFSILQDWSWMWFSRLFKGKQLHTKLGCKGEKRKETFCSGKVRVWFTCSSLSSIGMYVFNRVKQQTPLTSDVISRHSSQMTFYTWAVIEMQFIEKKIPLITSLRKCVCVCFECVYCVCYTLCFFSNTRQYSLEFF